MDNAPTRYATTADDVRIAYAVTGAGPALVHMPNAGVSSLLVDRALPERTRWVAQLSRRFTLVRYDMRGHGLSQRNVDDVSRDAFLRDLEAVVKALELDRFALFGFLGGAYLAPTYAAAHPRLVSHLLLWPPDTREMKAEEYRGLAHLAVSDWETFTETYAHLAMGWKHGRAAHKHAEVMRESTTQEMWLRLMAPRPAAQRIDATAAELSSVRTPTLVMQRRMKYAGDRISRIAAAIPGCQVVQFDGEDTLPYLGDSQLVVDTMARFVLGSPAVRLHAGPSEAPARAGEGDPLLTAREVQVIRLLAAGKSNQEIAEQLVLSVRTVERHLLNVYGKIGASGKAARVVATAYALTRPLDH